jgi:hypothetical protein
MINRGVRATMFSSPPPLTRGWGASAPFPNLSGIQGDTKGPVAHMSSRGLQSATAAAPFVG